VIARYQPIRCFDCGAVLAEEINDQLGNRDGRDTIDSLGAVEDVLVGRAELGVPAADQAGLFDDVEPRWNIVAPDVDIG
jgi:hypothetical protein